MGWQDRPYYRDGRRPVGGVLEWILNGSVPLFTLFGIRVRAHSSLVILIPLVIVFGFGGVGFSFEARFSFVAALFSIVLMHEFGHCFTARRVGGQADDILMSPLGGLAFAMAPRRPLATFLTVAGGPAVNVLLCLITGVYLYATGWPVPFNLFGLTVPHSGYAPEIFFTYPILYHINSFFLLFFAVSWGLLLFNLLPIYPMDGGQMLQAILWPHVGYYKSLKFASITGMIGAVILALYGIYCGSMLMVFIALSGFMTCLNLYQQLRYTSAAEYDSTEGVDYSASIYGTDRPQRKRTGGGWFKKKAASIAEERAEQDRIDSILAKVSATGMNSLSWFEKRALNQATERQRQRDIEHSRRMRM